MPLSESDVRSLLSNLVDPNTGKDYVSTRSVKGLKVAGADVQLEIELGYPGKSQFEPLKRSLVEIGRAHV